MTDFDANLQPQESPLQAGVFPQAADLASVYGHFFHQSLNAAAVIRQRDNRIVDVNQTFLTTYGYQRDDVLGRTPLELNLWVSPRDRYRCILQLQQHAQVSNFETQARTRTGELRQVRLSASRFAANGEWYIISTSEDITAQRRAEAALAESESRFQAVFHCAEAGIVCCDLSGHILNANPWFCEFVGWPEADLNGQYLWDFIDQPDRAHYLNERLQVLRQGQDTSILELRVQTLAQGLRWVHLSIALMPASATQPPYEIAVVSDISDRKQTELYLRQEMTHLRAVFMQLAIGVYQCNEAGQFIDVNQSFCELVGYSRAELVDQHFSLITHPQDLAGAMELYTRLIQGGLPSYTLEQRYICRDGQERWVSINMTQIHTTTQPHFAVAIVQEISVRREAEAELRQSEAKFAKAFHASPDAIAISTLNEGIYVDVNDSFLRMLGCQREDVVGKTEGDLDFWLAPARNRRIRMSLANDESIRDLELTGHSKEGKSLNLLLTAEQISLHGQPCALAFWRDITQQRTFEFRLRQQAEQEHLFWELTQRIRKSLDLDEILHAAVADVRSILKTHRVLICRVGAEYRGRVIVEAISAGIPSMLGEVMLDPALSGCLSAVEAAEPDSPTGDAPATIAVGADLAPATPPKTAAKSRGEQIHAPSNQTFYAQLLQKYQVKTNLIFPISSSESVWGFLEIHECRDRWRQWEPWQTAFLDQLTDQLSLAIQQSELYSQLQEANHELQRLALLDGLTRIANRRCFDDQIAQEWQRSQREQQPLALIMCDIDHFKRYNDTYGHPAGDSCLVQVAQALVRHSRRPADLVARYGGEEFAVILPNTDEIGAKQVAEQMRQAVGALGILHSGGVNGHITLSLGVAVREPTASYGSVLQLIEAADHALYAAKSQGRDQTYLATATTAAE